jgi:putative redox protein
MSEEAKELEKNLEDYKTKVKTDLVAFVELEKDLQFTARASGGYTIEYDAELQWGIMPTDSLLTSIAACMAIDMVSFLRKMRCDIKDFSMKAEASRNPDPPQYFKAVNLQITIKGGNIDKKKMDRAVSLSKDKYCSVLHTCRPDMEHTVTYEIVEE